ncbi:HAD family hydrolase [Chryseosolibacter indicus]|uniref:HAD family phosphatase n=1 Tax=Chryseosolibacter indicus TaxID=2782351 RepID=A0ABS5VPA7_9BACT|nr:HAD family phosphatase [Chryseosolibacter indicus]MBT1702619.1 HAD family phosphatase [Chryseosolibacter indicus]
MQPIAFLFDMDGVIIDSNPFHKTALKQFCKKHGHELTEEVLKEKIYGRTNKDWLTNLFGKLEPEKLKAYAEEKEQLFRDLYENDIRLVDGLDSFLKKLDEYKIPRAIATSAPRANVDFTLAKTGTHKYFETILDDSFVTEGKPNPQIYLKSAAALNFKPENCIVIEDSISGVQAGKNAGCKVIGITTTHIKEELADTDMIIENFVGLDPKEVISQLFRV